MWPRSQCLLVIGIVLLVISALGIPLGILATVVSVIYSFGEISGAGESVNPEALASGISKSLYAKLVGFGVSVLAAGVGLLLVVIASKSKKLDEAGKYCGSGTRS